MANKSQLKKVKQDIYELYMGYVKDYTIKLGERTAVFMQVGDFMEMYYFNTEHDQRNRIVCEYLADMLNIRVSKKSTLQKSKPIFISGFS